MGKKKSHSNLTKTASPIIPLQSNHLDRCSINTYIFHNGRTSADRSRSARDHHRGSSSCTLLVTSPRTFNANYPGELRLHARLREPRQPEARLRRQHSSPRLAIRPSSQDWHLQPVLPQV